MATPKSLVFTLYKHWEVIEHLVRLSRDFAAFEESLVLIVIGRHHPDGNADEQGAILRSLCNADLLQELSRTGDFQLNPFVVDFVRGLTREHELGLSSVLKARVDAIRDATALLDEGVNDGDTDRMREAANRLSELFRQIGQQLDQDRHAILELAEKAKSSDASMPSIQRYRTVLEAYDQYVEPMNEMMDSGLGGSFYPHLESAEHMLDLAVEKLSVRGSLYTHRLQLRQVAYQTKELRRLGRIVAQQCADTLLPLREEARQHNELSAAISELLGRVRKQGLAQALKKTTQPGLPLWQRTRRSRLSIGDEVRALIVEARNFDPKTEAFPEELTGNAADVLHRVDESLLRRQLAASLPVTNLMHWLLKHYPELPDVVVLRLYHDLVREPLWQADIEQEHTSTALKTVRVTYHPHRLEVMTVGEQDG